jgi:hypothetical protein
MTTPQDGREAFRHAGTPRYDAVRQAVLDIARREFGAVITGPVAAPLDGLRAAFAAEMTAQFLVRGYIEFARQAGLDWQAIGEAIGYHGPPAADQAYKYAATGPGKLPAWWCPACHQRIEDLGPALSPADGEAGHSPGCPGLTAAASAWQAAHQS